MPPLFSSFARGILLTIHAVVRIGGIEASIIPEPARGYRQAQSISYTLTARGKAYQDVQNQAFSLARLCDQLTPAHFLSRFWHHLPGVFAKDPFDAKHERSNNCCCSGKRYLDYPSTWSWYTTVHLPDVFEERQYASQCDA